MITSQLSLNQSLARDHQLKKSISRHTKSLLKSMTKRYSSNKKSVKKIAAAKEFVNKRIESNQLQIIKFQESLQRDTLGGQIFNQLTNPQLMETILFLVKTSICILLLPLIIYIKNKPDKVLNYENLYQFFVIQHSDTITKILTQTSLEHPVAISYLSEQFIYNPLGKILMRFSLFQGIVNAINHIKRQKEVLERKIMEVIGRSIFNYETFYALKHALESFYIPKNKLSSIEKAKYISKASGTILTIFDLILCGTKSSWCQSLQPIQKITYVFPIFVELGTIIYDVTQGVKRKGDVKDPLEIAALGFQHYCQKTFKFEDNLYIDASTITLNELEKSFVSFDYKGPKEIKKEYEAKFKMYQLMSDPKRLVEMAKSNPNFKKEFRELLIETEKSRIDNIKVKSKIEYDADMIVENLNDYHKANLYCQLYRKTFKMEQHLLRTELASKRDNLLLGPLGKHKISKERFRYKPWYKMATALATLYTLNVSVELVRAGQSLQEDSRGLTELITQNVTSLIKSLPTELERIRNTVRTPVTSLIDSLPTEPESIQNTVRTPVLDNVGNFILSVFPVFQMSNGTLEPYNKESKSGFKALKERADKNLERAATDLETSKKKILDQKEQLLSNLETSKNEILEQTNELLTRARNNFVNSFTTFNLRGMGYKPGLILTAAIVAWSAKKDTRVDDLDDQIDNINLTQEMTKDLDSSREIKELQEKKKIEQKNIRVQQEKDAENVIFRSLLFGFINSITAPNDKIKNEITLKKMYTLLDDQYLTPEQRKEIQELIATLEKKNKKKSLKKRTKEDTKKREELVKLKVLSIKKKSESIKNIFLL